MIERLMRITAPHFVAGVVVHGATIVRAAPIVHWMRGQQLDALYAYARLKGWRVQEIQETRG